MPNQIDIRPPARLSALLLGGVLAMSVALAWAVPRSLHRERVAAAQTVNAAAMTDAGDAASRALRLALALGDRVLAGEVARELVSADARIEGIRVRLADGGVVEAGHLDEAEQTSITREIAGIEPAADLLWLGDWPMTGQKDASRSLGTIEIHAADPTGAMALATRGAAYPFEIWLILSFGVLGSLGGALYVRHRIVKLGRVAADIASGSLDSDTAIRGGDEVAWIAGTLGEVRHLVREQVDRVHGRNATLLAHVTVQGDRLERIARFASTLVAPVVDLDAFERVLATLGEELDAPLVLLFVPDPASPMLRCIGARGVAPQRIGPLDPQTQIVARSLTGDRPASAGRLDPEHPWMLAAGREVPLTAVTHVPVHFRGKLEGLLVVARKTEPNEADLDFMLDASRPMAIALANRAAYQASVELSEALEDRNEVLIAQRDQLQVVNRMRSEFTANMSHELRTPLNAIIGYGELMVDGLYGPVNDQQTEALEGIEQSARSLLTMVNQVLDLSSAEVGQLSVDFESCELDEVIHEAVLIARPLARNRPYDIKASGPAMTLETDPQRVLQIVTNLLNNAIKFTDEGSVVVQSSRRADGGATITVRDTGIGIPKDQLDLIFEEFRQVDQSSTRAHDGVGLGLAISRKLAGALGGTLTVESKEGRGSAFTLELPHRPPRDSSEESANGGETSHLHARRGADTDGWSTDRAA